VNDGAELGSAVALTADRIIAGAPAGTFAQPTPAGTGANPAPAGGGGRGGRGSVAPAPGLVVVFQRLGGQWKEGSTLAPFDIAAARFGAATSVLGNELWIGAPGSDGIGRIYRAQRDKTGEWSTMVKLLDESVDVNAQFGAAFAVDGNRAVIGMPGDGGGGGTVAFFERSQAGDWVKRSSDFPAPAERMAAVTGKEALCAEGKLQTFDCNGISLVSFLPLAEIGGKRGVRLSGSWGWTDPVTGRDISIIGRTDGTAFVDITDPLRPKYLGDLMRPRGTSMSTWREMKTYKNFVLVVSDGSGDRHGVQIFDLTRLRGVTRPQHFTEDAHYDLGSIHNIVVSEEAGYAYAVGVNASGENCAGGSHIIDLRVPTKPKFAGCFADATTGRAGRGYTHDGQCVKYKGPDTRYTGHEICVMSNETHISIQDMTDKANPKVLGRGTYPTAGYIHQTWFTEDQRHIFLDDELDEGGFGGTAAAFGNVCPCGAAAQGTRTLVWDLSDLTDPVLKKEYIATTKETDHNQYVKGNRLYQSNYGAGLRILDISDPVNPREVGFLNTGGSTWSNYPWFKNGTVAFTTGSQGLFVVRDRTTTVFVP
jgi:choice-of-anchor B domain-containing protein